MSQLASLFDKTEQHFLLQGITALQNENVEYRNKMVQRLVPGDHNVPTILEYCDKRSAQLQQLQKKIAGFVNSP